MKDFVAFFRWQDALDILILSFVFYRVYLWLRRKRALRMILAILALPFLYLLAQWIDLPLTVWGLQNLWAVILFVLVVVFQQEIRSALGSIALPRFLFGRPEGQKLPAESVDKIVEAAFRMASKRIGGLIVLQRKNDLEEFTHGKVLLDSQITEDLLLSIFHPQSPLHDGAVIIQEDRLRYATALLPVSRAPMLPKEWGTRHRAGIGITEVSDAECIIVSEERGEVWVASLGKAKKMEGKEDLAKNLGKPPVPIQKGTRLKRLRRSLLRDFRTKVFFLLGVCAFWIFVMGFRQGEISFDIPTEYYSIPSNLEIVGDPPKEINVRLRGSQRLLASLKPDQIRARIDLFNTRPGVNQVSLSEANMKVPSGITVTNFYPRRIRVQLAKTSKSKPTP
jgi:diadenylate cyclase